MKPRAKQTTEPAGVTELPNNWENSDPLLWQWGKNSRSSETLDNIENLALPGDRKEKEVNVSKFDWTWGELRFGKAQGSISIVTEKGGP